MVECRVFQFLLLSVHLPDFCCSLSFAGPLRSFSLNLPALLSQLQVCFGISPHLFLLLTLSDVCWVTAVIFVVAAAAAVVACCLCLRSFHNCSSFLLRLRNFVNPKNFSDHLGYVGRFSNAALAVG